MLTELWPIRESPVSELLVSYGGREHSLLLKRESFHASGSIKERTAVGLLRRLDKECPLRPGSVVVESTSGNLGLALAHLLAQIDCRLIAVIDPKMPTATREALRSARTQMHLVREPDGHGGYLLSRLEAVRRLCRDHPDYRWTDQYENQANARIHEETTGAEILRQGGSGLDAVYVAVSTGGTLAGIARRVRRSGRPVKLVAVDSLRSLATGEPFTPLGERSAHARILSGIGASRRSRLLGPHSFDRRAVVDDSTAIAMCRILREDTGIGVGGSTGSVLSAYVSDLRGSGAPAQPLCLAPDDADRYEDSLYLSSWLRQAGVLDAVQRARKQFRAQGLMFKGG